MVVGIAAVCCLGGAIALSGIRRALSVHPLPRPEAQCAPTHYCLRFSRVTLAIPGAYAHPLAPGIEMLGDINPGSGWFLFWMPDGAPAAGVRETGFYMFPDAFTKPVDRASRTLVEVSLRDWTSEKELVGPDQQLRNRDNENVYFHAHDADAARYSGHPDPVRVEELTEGTTATIVDVTTMIGDGAAFRSTYGRVACEGKTCLAHFFYQCAVSIPYPPYRVCDGNFAIRSRGISGYVRFIQVNDQTTLAMTDRIVAFLNDWASPF